jgi:2-amino-4-hydroxy-6-hydroxymethyldihydropteridine diphosphokinase
VSTAVLALGANLGDRAANLQLAVDALARAAEILAVSAIFETVPVVVPGSGEQPDYYNAVVSVRTDLTPLGLLGVAHEIEATAGRVRDVRWGPRTLDVDIVVFDEVVSDDPVLTLPHPRAHERAFVLAPWVDIDPDARIPGRGAIAQLLADLGMDGVHRLEEPVLQPRGSRR